MSNTPAFFPIITKQLIERASRAYLSHLSPTSHTLRHWLTETLSRPPGQPDALLADPVFEAMWSWTPAEPTMQELAGTLLHPELVAALDAAPEDTRFGAAWHPFAHQLEAWRRLSGEPRSLVVSSGTGSGKTECFLIPILDRLVREAERAARPLVGVRALFLYPLNALIASQRERLSSWLSPFDGRIRYALYNADLPRVAPKSGQRLRHEVDHRKALWDSPPPILVTNSTMLEYMLVRNDDAPLLEKSQGMLEWIVLDEAHTYVGSQAAETALLLRRVLSAFGCSAEQVRFIATSATIGSGSEDDRRALREYLASIAGVDPSRVEVVIGKRAKPTLPEVPSPRDIPLSDVAAELDALPPERRYHACTSIRPTRRIIEVLAEREAKLTELVEAAGADPQRSSDAGTTMLELLDRVREVRDPQGRALLPLRGHFFQRTIAGVWACVNRNCLPEVDGGDWVFGRLYFARRETCECGAPVFPLVLCRNCGAEYLAAEGNPPDLRPRVFELDDDEGDDEGDDEERENSNAVASHMLICGHDHKPPRKFRDSQAAIEMRPFNWEGAETQFCYGQGRDGTMRCRECGEQENKQRRLFRPLVVGAPFMLGTSIPVLLEHAPLAKQPGAQPLPAGGRRTITFTDSRQGTGYFALKARADAERNFVRSAIWAALRPHPPSLGQRERWAALAREREDMLAGLAALPELYRRAALDGIAAIDAELAERDRPPALDWKSARRVLLSSPNLSTWAAADWRDYVEEGQTLAQFFVYREFMRRPTRASSLESLGLVALRYPALRKLGDHDLPVSAARLGMSLSDWTDYLTLLLDYLVRSNVATRVTERFGDDLARNYPFDYLRWMGTRIRYRAMTAPDYTHQGPRAEYLRGWPRSSGGRARLVSLLALAFGADISSGEVSELLRDAWDTLVQRGLLVRVSKWLENESDASLQREVRLGTLDKGYVLPLDTQVELAPVERAYLCPITRRMLPVALRGLSPYIDKAQDPIPCEVFAMPRPPVDPCELADWLEHDPTIVELRERGVWTENSDRIVSGAIYFRVVEHSANVDGPRLRERERAFRRGELNLLSCSTTMEMGVDIGGITSVSMNNAPPAPANYLQRAGRAGRRSETGALSLTLCSAVPHGEAVFREPRWPFTTPIRVPRVSMDSTRIVQRHVNAICLRTFLLRVGRSGHQDRMKLTMGWFFGRSALPVVSEEWRRFTTMLSEPELPELDVALRQLVAGSPLAGLNGRSLRESVIGAIESVVEPWSRQRDALEAQLVQLGGTIETIAEASIAQIAVTRQLRRLLHEYLLRELAARGFLPGHGFPTQVVPLINTTFEDMDRAKRQRQNNALGERNESALQDPDYPTRDLAVAIREYAPGNAVVIDGRIYESAGVTLNWKVPAGLEQAAEVQSFRYAWWCLSCDIQDTGAIWRKSCPSCGEDVKAIRYMQPAGFAVRLDYRPHNDLSQRRFVTACKPWISTGSRWQPLLSPAHGRMRSSSNGMIFHHSKGISQHGYALCLRCGFATSELPPVKANQPLPPEMEHHTRLRGRRDDGERVCPGVQQQHGIRRYLSLGGQLETDVFELQLSDPATGEVLNETRATTLAVALRRALAELVGVEDREIGWSAKQTSYEGGAAGYSIALYDTASGGAGFVTQARDRIRELLEVARQILACPRRCERACHGCLLTYDTQSAIDHIDRREGARFLSERFVDGFELPAALQLLGPATRVEYDALHVAIERERSQRGATQLRIYLGGAGEDWELPEWELRRVLDAWSTRLDVRLLASSRLLANLPDTASRSLAALLDWLPKVRLHVCNERADGLIAELQTRDGVVRWASPCGLIPGPNRTADTYLGESTDALTALDFPEIEASMIRPGPPEGLETVNVFDQLDGQISHFAAKLWAMILPHAPQLALKLSSGARIAEIAYSDRYIMTPLVARLAVDLVHGFAMHAAANMGSETVVNVLCIAYASTKKRPRLLKNEWQHCTIRDEAVRGLLERRLGGTVGCCETVTGDRGHVAHARGLYVRFHDGTQWKLRLDEGVGFMRASDGHIFPFDADVATQVEALATLDIDIYKRYPFPSPMFVGQAVR